MFQLTTYMNRGRKHSYVSTGRYTRCHASMISWNRFTMAYGKWSCPKVR